MLNKNITIEFLKEMGKEYLPEFRYRALEYLQHGFRIAG